MVNVRLAGGHLYGKHLFTWLSRVVSLMASFCAVPFPPRCFGWDLGLKLSHFLRDFLPTLTFGVFKLRIPFEAKDSLSSLQRFFYLFIFFFLGGGGSCF